MRARPTDPSGAHGDGERGELTYGAIRDAFDGLGGREADGEDECEDGGLHCDVLYVWRCDECDGINKVGQEIRSLKVIKSNVRRRMRRGLI